MKFTLIFKLINFIIFIIIIIYLYRNYLSFISNLLFIYKKKKDLYKFIFPFMWNFFIYIYIHFLCINYYEEAIYYLITLRRIKS